MKGLYAPTRQTKEDFVSLKMVFSYISALKALLNHLFMTQVTLIVDLLSPSPRLILCKQLTSDMHKHPYGSCFALDSV